ncbi:MAG: YigZ family protein [Chloroflexota bacterium]|nr:YigZ family protein [Chloroflexota bacterium]
MPSSYLIPAAQVRTEIVIKKSRFISTAQLAASVPEARAVIARLREEMPDANHHVYAFRVGFGKSVTEGMSDDGEPTGTSGPPTLAVLRGSGVGDIALVTARYFGGTKLGTGGLVRAYTESAQAALSILKTELKVEKRVIGLEMPYSLYNVVKRLIATYRGEIQEEEFAAQVLIIARFATDDLAAFSVDLQERTSAQVSLVNLS